MSQNLKGRVALVTGGVSGLGEAACKELLRNGVSVVALDLNEEMAKKMMNELEAYKTSFKFIKVDVTNEEQVKSAVEETIKTFGGLHIVLNCAGIIHAKVMVSSKGLLSSEDMKKVLNINVVGTLNVCKYSALAMSKQQTLNSYNERGVIINVASVAGIEGQIGQTVYSASKGAIIGMTLPMARELGRFGIRVVTIAPGIFETPMAHSVGMKGNKNDEIGKGIPLGRVGRPEEFADAIIGICKSTYMTGEILRVDGGIRLGPSLQQL